MLKIGYVRLQTSDASEDIAALRALGCQVIRAEDAHPDTSMGPVLRSILEFIGAGDQLVVNRLEHLADTSRDLLDLVSKLETRGASLHIAEPDLTTLGPGGRALKAALEAIRPLEAVPRKRRSQQAEAQEIRDLQRAGVGPVEIARRLGVSRMTVWRKLKALETQQASPFMSRSA